MRKAEIERHSIEGECVATLWTATFAPPDRTEIVVPIFDFFQIQNGGIKEIRSCFDPGPLEDAV